MTFIRPPGAAESGDAAEARALLARLQALPSNVYVPPTSLAMIMPIKTYPFMDKIRQDPRYLGLLRKMNLA